MTKVSPGARVFTVVSEKDADQFAVAAQFCLDMSREQATTLLEEGYIYAAEFAVYSKSPRSGKVQELLEGVETQAGAAAQVLNELTAETIPDSGTDRLAELKQLDELDPGAVAAHYLQRRRKGERDLRTLAADMQRLSAVASEVLERITAAWQSLYHFTVGGAVEDGRLTTLPAYFHLPSERRTNALCRGPLLS